jgi:VCBS repeat-containing protein
MATELDYAALSARVYWNVRGTRNVNPIPNGWQEIIYDPYDDLAGFIAGAYKNEATKEIVIAYKGTDTSDPVTATWDWLANLSLGTGIGSLQALAAAQFYLDIKDDPLNAGYTISFTGHSLGGGLASIMSVWFDRKATVFDVAPFKAGAINILQTLPSTFQDTALSLFQLSLETALFWREANVTGYAIEGEALQGLRMVIPYIEGHHTPIYLGGREQVGVGDVDRAIDLHSMNLLAAMMMSPKLKQATDLLPGLAKWFFEVSDDPNANPYANPLESNNPDFLAFLLNDQIAKGYESADGLLNRFAADLERMASGTRDRTTPDVDLATRLAIDYYYRMENGFTGEDLFRRTAGGAQFDLTRFQVPLSDIAPYSDLQTLARQRLGNDSQALPLLDAFMADKHRWTLAFQGSNGLGGAAPTDAVEDLVIGGEGNDRYETGEGADFLIGGQGDDTLEGGQGDDTLVGGQGFDIYIFHQGDGSDRLIDSDMQGRIVIDGAVQNLIPAAFIETAPGSGVWKSPDGKLTLTHHSPWQLVLEDGSTIELGDNFQDGDFGIHRREALTALETTHTILGDQNPSASDYPNDFLFDTAANDLVQGLSGDDYLMADYGGNDRLEGGAGDDIAAGRDGDDVILGGEGQDLLRGDAGQDRLYAGEEWTLDQALARQDLEPGGLRGDFFDGGDEDDSLFGETGNDALNGGRGNDVILGGAGDDDLDGDLETSLVTRDWSVQRRVETVGGVTNYISTYHNVDFEEPTQGGDDAIYAGGGADWVRAGQGDDWADGGAGDDVLFGESGHDTLLGGVGGDILWGDSFNTPDSEQGNDYLDGGTGADTLQGAGGDDILFGGDDGDSLYGDGSGGPQGDDYLNGEAGDDTLLGAGGNDTLYGGSGGDWLQGDSSGTGQGDGDDLLDGEAGDDTLLGEGGGDILHGGDGNDTLLGDGGPGEGGNDELFGGDGDDLLLGQAGEDSLYGGDGDDLIAGDEGGSDIGGSADFIDGGAGNDVIDGQGGDDMISGGAGNDLIAGGFGDDTLGGGDDADELQGGFGNDAVSGGSGNDILFGEDGDDQLDGGAGDDQLQGGFGNDAVSGGGGNDILFGEDGDDWLYGGDGDDFLIGGAGSDVLDGGAGNDVYYIDAEDRPKIVHVADSGGLVDWVVLTGFYLIDLLRLDTGSLKLVFNDGSEVHLDDFNPDDPYAAGGIEYIQFAGGEVLTRQDLIRMYGIRVEGTPGEDRLTGTALGETIRAYESNDIVTARGGDDLVYLGAGDDWSEAGDGNDRVWGGDGHDTMYGGAGADRLYGEAGNDFLAGGAGNDWLEGGEGDDIYYFGRGDGPDTALDGAGNDAIQLAGNLALDDVAFTRQGDDLLVSVKGSSGDRLTVKNWFGSASSFRRVLLADGTVLDRAAVESRLLANQPPVAAEDPAAVSEDGVLAASGNVLANDADPEGRPLRVVNPGTYAGAYGALTLNANGSYTYALNNASAAVQGLAAGQTVTERFAYTASDDDPAGAATSTSFIVVGVTGRNDAPVAVADAAAVAEDSAVTATGNVLANDSDLDAGAVLRVAAPGSQAGLYGTLTLGSDGAYTYALNNSAPAVQSLGRYQQATERFGYSVTDGIAAAASTLDIRVTGTNDAPVVAAPLADQTVATNTAYSWQLPDGSFTDVDQGDVLGYTATLADGSPLPSWLAFDPVTRTFSGRVPRDAAGFLDIRVTATDAVDGNPDRSLSLSVSDDFRLTFGSGHGGGGGGHGGGSGGNEGVGNGEDPPPPGHGDNLNDGPGTGPGQPGARGGFGPGNPPLRRADLRAPEILVAAPDLRPAVALPSVRSQTHQMHGDRQAGTRDRPRSEAAPFAGWAMYDPGAARAARRGLPVQANGSAAPDGESGAFREPAYIDPGWAGEKDASEPSGAAGDSFLSYWTELDQYLDALLSGRTGTGQDEADGLADGFAPPGFLGSTTARPDDPLSLGDAGLKPELFQGLREGFRRVA